MAGRLAGYVGGHRCRLVSRERRRGGARLPAGRALGAVLGGRAAYAAARQRRAGRGVAKQQIKYDFPRVPGCGAAPVTVHTTTWAARMLLSVVALGAGNVGMIAEAAYPAGHEAGAVSRRAIRAGIAAEYAEPHGRPWIGGFSGGKDRTAVTHSVVEHLLSRGDRRRPCAAGDSDRSPHGFDEFTPFPDFRSRLVSIRKQLHRRLTWRRNRVCPKNGD